MKFIHNEEIMTIPDYFTFEAPGSFSRPGGVRDVLQQTGDRDPLPMMGHSTIGHSLDALRQRHLTRPIRDIPYAPSIGR